jgi:hypothetical protein
LLKQTALADRRCLLTEIPSGDLDVTVFGQVPPTQFPLSNHLEPGPLEVERLDAPLRRWALIEEALEDPAGDPHGALIRPRITENSTASPSSFQRASSGNSKNSIS